MLEYSAPYRWFYKPKYTLKNIEYFFRWIRNIFVRGINGWCPEDTWNWDYHIARINIEALEYHKKYKMGFPCGFDEDKTKAELKWDILLQDMIDGFKAVIELSELNWMDAQNPEEERKRLEEIKDKGLKTYIECFESLWD